MIIFFCAVCLTFLRIVEYNVSTKGKTLVFLLRVAILSVFFIHIFILSDLSDFNIIYL